MATFSTPPTDANELSGIINVLGVLPDNTSKQINPKDVRDAFYTLWENTIFKPTSISASTTEYIGFDQSQLKRSEVNWYPKVYFGKKEVSGSSVLSQDLIENSDADFYFYNTKNNSGGNYDTKIGILAGTLSLYQNGALSSPYLESKVVTTIDGNYLDFNIVNNSYVVVGPTQYGGNLNVKSEKSYVTINDFYFPKASEITSDKDGYVLKYKWIGGRAYGVWESAFSQSVTSLISNGGITISGSTVQITGYNFTDSNIVATAIGGINAGETFSNVDVLDMFRRIIYTYVKPRVTTYIGLGSSLSPTTLVESGDDTTYGNLRLNYSVTINSTHSLSSFVFDTGSDAISGSLPAANSFARTTTTGFVNPNADNNLLSQEYYRIQSWTLSSTDTYPSTVKSNLNLKIVTPYYWGTSTTFATQSSGASNINDILGENSSSPINFLRPTLIEPILGSASSTNNQSVNLTTVGIGDGQDGNGVVYFGYPINNPALVEIKDQNGFPQGLGTDFKTYSISITSPNGWWGDVNYLFYISSASTSIPVSSTNWQFNFATQS
jgi:hypothetical protein